MSMLDVLDAALQSVNVAYHEFLARYDATKRSIYGFVEGKDDPSFYKSVLERFVPEDWNVELFVAGNRNKVLEVEVAFDWTRFSRRQIAFFIDQDLVHFLNPELAYPENIYVTDGYSIENSIVTREVLSRLLEEVHNIVDWTEAEKQLVLTHFDNELLRFQTLLSPIMAQIALWRRDEVKANLANFDLNSLFQMENGSITPKEGFEDVAARIGRLCECVGAVKSPDAERDDMLASFQAANGPSTLTRGKYLVWFLSAIANDCHARVCHFVASYKVPPKSRLTLGPNNLVVVAAPRARIPASLRRFIEITFIAHIEGATIRRP